MESDHGHYITVALGRRVENGADAAQIGDAIALTLQGMDAALRPVIGQRGVAAIYLRSLYLVGTTHPGFQVMHKVDATSMDIAGLKSALAQQGSGNAAAYGGALLETFYEVLTTLIGASLTERLLRSSWESYLSGSPGQDPSA